MTAEERVAMAVTLLGATFNREVTDPMLEAYLIALRDVPEGKLGAAVHRAIAECKFMPTPAELLAFAGLARNLAAEIAQAWEAVRTAVRKHDYLVLTIDFGPRVNAVVRNMGGWLALTDRPRDQLDVWGRKEFERIYLALAETEPRALNGTPLMGWLAGRVGGHPITIAVPGQPALPALDRAPEVKKLADAKS